MTARARQRGHRIVWVGHKWLYADWTDPQHNGERPCTNCGNPSNGHDYCLGSLRYVRAACCGHGFPEDAYFIFHDGTGLRREDAVRLKECWIDHCVTPGDVIEMYLRVRDVEDVYLLCRLCSAGAVTLPSVLNVIDTFRRNSLDFASICGILEVHSNTNQETSMNTKAITNIQRQVDILSDGHQEVVDQALKVTAAVSRMDARIQKSKETGNWSGGKVCSSQVITQFDGLKDQLQAQAARALRVCEEIDQIQSTLKIE